MILEEVAVAVDEAKRFVKAASRACGILDEEASIFSDVLVEADMRGVMTHGIVRLPEYLDRIVRGGAAKSLCLTVLKEWPWGGALDAGNGIGHVAAYRGMQWVINKAKACGIGLATMRMSTHFGMAAYYSLMAAKQGMIGIAASNSPPLMAPWGGKEKKVGNNPFAIAAPGKEFPLSFDIACTVAARGKLDQARREGKPIPEGWALNPDGRETTDPEEAIRGVLLPLAGHKGYGLAVMIDMFTGILSGGKVSPNIKNKYHFSTPRNIGHFFMAVDVEHFQPMEEFLKNADDYVRILHETETAAGFDKVRVPGEGSEKKKQDSLKHGIRYHRATIDLLNDMARRFNAPPLQMKK